MTRGCRRGGGVIMVITVTSEEGCRQSQDCEDHLVQSLNVQSKVMIANVFLSVLAQQQTLWPQIFFIALTNKQTS